PSVYRGVLALMNYPDKMNGELYRTRISALSTAALVFLSFSQICTADNPYTSILPRNAFSIQDPPPPVEPPPPPPVAKPPANIFLTGFAEWDDGKRVYLMVNRPGGKAAEYLTLKEGEHQDEIEIVQIDDSNESVRIRNNGVE